ncbi:MAG: nucleoid-associated protein, YbaB/EbfC family [Chloroflexi bacterium RBG_13_68_17]|nr:MAG: nucleoid-associated protein, YbaB/EbfC family [Chloroflexi bacterium RBG_13_68_17]
MSKGKGPGGPGLMAQMQRLQEALVKAQAELVDMTVEASAGGGAVRVVMSGTQECRQLHIAPGLLTDGDVQMLQDLVLLAVNQAIRDSQALAARTLGPLTGGLGLPGVGG